MIVTAVERRKNKTRQDCLCWICSDGVSRTTPELSRAVGMAESTVIKRWHVYGVHWLITYKGKIKPTLHNKYKLKEHKQYHNTRVVEPDILRTRTGRIVPPNGRYDYLIPCPPAATGPYAKGVSCNI